MLPVEPLKAVFALVVHFKSSGFDSSSARVRDFLGTGFFVRDDGTFLTARHVFDGVELRQHEQMACVVLGDGLAVYPVTDVRLSDTFDIAIGRATGAHDIQPLRIATEDPPLNRDVLTIEFSGTHSELLRDGRTAINLIWYHHKGHVMRIYTSECPEAVPTKSLDLSFAALRGASGAPVIVEDKWTVAGMVVANIERHLLPAQIVSTVVADTEREEIRYFLPMGKAISWQHLREFIDASQ